MLGVREWRDISRAELSRMMGVQQSTLNAWEADEAVPTGNNLIRLVNTLGVTTRWLDGDEDQSGDERGPDDIGGSPLPRDLPPHPKAPLSRGRAIPDPKEEAAKKAGKKRA